MPPAIQRLIVPLLALLSLAPLTAGAPLVPDALNGQGTATTFQIFGAGTSVEGAPFEWTNVCAYCTIRVTLSDAGFVLVDPNGELVGLLDPGQYEFREYRGSFSLTQNAPRDFFIEAHGTGKINKLQ